MRWDSLIHNYTYQQEAGDDGNRGRSVPYERTREEFVSLRFAIADLVETLGADLLGKQRKDLGKATAIGIDRLAKTIEKTIDIANQQNKIFLQLNKNLPQAFAENTKQLNAMPGDLEGKLTTLFAFQKEGFTDVGTATASLAGRLKVTGQSIQALIEANKTLFIQGRLQQGQIDAFNKNLANLSIRYQVSTEKLLEGMSQLNESLGILSLAGTLGGTQKAITGLAAQFPILSRDIGRFTDQFVTADVGQLGILGGINNLGRLTSGQVSDAQDLRRIISQTAARTRDFTKNFKEAGPFAQRAIKNIVGDLGVLSLQLDDALNNSVNRISETDKLFSDLGITLKTAFEPFARGLANTTIQLGQFVANLVNLIPGAEGKKGDAATLILGQALGLKFFSKIGLSTAVTKGLVTVGFPVLISKVVVIGGILATVLGAMKLIKAFNEKTEESAKKTADNTAELVKIQRSSRVDPFGTSKFERLAAKSLQDNIFRVALTEAVATKAIKDGFETQAQLLGTLVEQGLVPAPLTVRE